VRAGSKSEQKDAGITVAEAGDGLAPIIPIEVGAALLTRDGCAVFYEPRTATTIDEFAVQLKYGIAHKFILIRKRKGR
jgi:hypothetical protein